MLLPTIDTLVLEELIFSRAFHRKSWQCYKYYPPHFGEVGGGGATGWGRRHSILPTLYGGGTRPVPTTRSRVKRRKGSLVAMLSK